MEKADCIIIGGGAAGLFCAAQLKNKSVIILERGDRVGKKLSSTGNGQGNVTNENMSAEHYFSVNGDKNGIITSVLSRFDKKKMLDFLESLGGVFVSDSRGRVYPSCKQASAVTDLLRYSLSASGVKMLTGHYVTGVERTENGYRVVAECEGKSRAMIAGSVVVCPGGKAAKNFGTDGNGFALSKKLGHGVSELYPSLVQIKTDTAHIKTLKGIRVNARVTAIVNGIEVAECVGDVIFADYGVSGDAIFKISAFITDKLQGRVQLSLDLMPDISEQKLAKILENKQKISGIPSSEQLCGILNNQIGRAVLRRAGSNNANTVASLVKRFTLDVSGSLGFDYAQVTKGGVLLDGITLDLESKRNKSLYMCGEILDVDGECGGYNLQWAYSSASVVAEAINRK